MLRAAKGSGVRVAVISGLANESQYRNDEQMSDTMRAVLFQKTEPGSRAPSLCTKDGVVSADCFSAIRFTIMRSGGV